MRQWCFSVLKHVVYHALAISKYCNLNTLLFLPLLSVLLGRMLQHQAPGDVIMETLFNACLATLCCSSSVSPNGELAPQEYQIS